MADVNAINEALAVAGTKVPVAVRGAPIQQITDEYEASGDAIGTDIVIGQLKKGDFTAIDSYIAHDAMGASVTLGLSIRDSDGNETVLIAAASASSAGTITPGDAAVLAAPIEVTDEKGVDVIVKIAGGAATGTIKARVAYTAPN